MHPAGRRAAGIPDSSDPSSFTTSSPASLLSARQAAHAQQCLYRTLAGVTAFRARDPDPAAVDSGRVLGVRIEVVSRGRFLRPYYVLLNRPYGEANDNGVRGRFLRVHRHTVPPCVQLAALAARYLPPPSAAGGGQDLPRFVRELRRALVRYHNRVGVIKDLRRAAGLGGGGSTHSGDDKRLPEKEGHQAQSDTARGIVDIRAADAEAKQVTLEWSDGRTGRLVVRDDGQLVAWAIFGGRGSGSGSELVRDRETTRRLLGLGNERGGGAEATGDARRLEDVVRRLSGVDM